MEQRSLHFSSKNRQQVGFSEAHDFTIRFEPTPKLSRNMKHEMAVNRILMTYSWHNIMPEYANKTSCRSTVAPIGKQSHLSTECTRTRICQEDYTISSISRAQNLGS